MLDRVLAGVGRLLSGRRRRTLSPDALLHVDEPGRVCACLRCAVRPRAQRDDLLRASAAGAGRPLRPGAAGPDARARGGRAQRCARRARGGARQFGARVRRRPVGARLRAARGACAATARGPLPRARRRGRAAACVLRRARPPDHGSARLRRARCPRLRGDAGQQRIQDQGLRPARRHRVLVRARADRRGQTRQPRLAERGRGQAGERADAPRPLQRVRARGREPRSDLELPAGVRAGRRPHRRCVRDLLGRDAADRADQAHVGAHGGVDRRQPARGRAPRAGQRRPRRGELALAAGHRRRTARAAVSGAAADRAHRAEDHRPSGAGARCNASGSGTGRRWLRWRRWPRRSRTKSAIR